MPKSNDKALFKITYGLYALTTKYNGKDNALIVNTVCQLMSNPIRIAVTVNKNNYSYEAIIATRKMNVNTLSETAPFKVFEAFGFRSGRDTNKFEGCSPNRSENGLVVLPRFINSYMSLEVEDIIDLGTHGCFICSVCESEVVSEERSMTYSYYHENVKPKPEVKKTGYVCKICGYIHDEEQLPDDFECPICKHGAADFEKITIN